MGNSITLKNIVIVAMPNMLLLDVAGPSDVFFRASRVLDAKGVTDTYKVAVISSEPTKVVRSASELEIVCKESFETWKEPIDTLLIAGFSSTQEHRLSEEFLEWLKQESKKVRRIGSICRGTFVLAKAGILNGHRAATHWLYCSELQNKYPEITVMPDSIFVKDENIYTSAGVSTGMDLALALVEEDYGREVAVEVARQLVLFLRRPGNQSQFSVVLSHQEPTLQPLRDLQRWILDHLNESLTVEKLADKSAMSPRNFARVFQKEVGMTAGKYIEKIRVEAARRRLEETNHSLDQIAKECGTGSADSLRRLFLRHLKITPSEYRRSFKTALELEVT